MEDRKVMMIGDGRRSMRGAIAAAMTSRGKPEVTESGLVVPGGTQAAGRPRRVLTRESYRQVMRAVKALEAEGCVDPKSGVSLVMICDGCSKIIRVQKHENRKVLGCECSVRDVV